ncbi:MAG: DUF418 domain-containing protein [Sphingobium sp.]
MTASSRLPAMDMLRGCAVLGILWMNITAFAFPSAVYFNPAAAGQPSAADSALWLLGFVAVDGKMRGLFSLLFGASMLLLIDREEMAGRNGARTQLIRLAWLLPIGVGHHLLWWGDILMIYAIIGPVALLFVRMEPVALARSAFLAFLLHFLLTAAIMTALHIWSLAATAPGGDPAAGEGYRAFIAQLSDPADPAISGEYAIFRGGLWGIVAHNWAEISGRWLWGLLLSAFDTLGFMLLGMAMAKAGFLTGRWEAAQYRSTARHCFLIGLPPMIALAVWLIGNGFPPLATFGATIAWSFPFRVPLVVGWAALILWLWTRHRGSLLVARLAAAGRMTLSNYLGTTLLMTTLFHGWGFGLFGHVPMAMLPLVVLGGWAVMLAWSAPWLSRFAMGPAEWLWRSLCRGKMQQIRKSD